VKHFLAIVMIAIGLLLALDTKGSPWDRSEPLWTDLLVAMGTDPKRTLFYPTKSRPHASQQVRVAVKMAYRKVSLRSVLYFIQRICTLLDNDSIPVENDLLQLCLPAFEDLFKLV
jgi:hypothetical protein